VFFHVFGFVEDGVQKHIGQRGYAALCIGFVGVRVITRVSAVGVGVGLGPGFVKDLVYFFSVFQTFGALETHVLNKMCGTARFLRFMNTSDVAKDLERSNIG